MFTLPSLVSMPAFGVFGVGPLDIPTVGSFFGWMLIAALVGSALGILRRMGEDRRVTPANRVVTFHVVPAADARHKEAA